MNEPNFTINYERLLSSQPLDSTKEILTLSFKEPPAELPIIEGWRLVVPYPELGGFSCSPSSVPVGLENKTHPETKQETTGCPNFPCRVEECFYHSNREGYYWSEAIDSWYYCGH